MVEQQRVDGEREADGGEAQRLEEAGAQLLGASRRACRAPGSSGPTQSGCEPIDSTNGVRTKTKSALVSVPIRYGQRRLAGARSATTSRSRQITATDVVCAARSAVDDDRREEGGCGGGAHLRHLVAVAERGRVGGELLRRCRHAELEPHAVPRSPAGALPRPAGAVVARCTMYVRRRVAASTCRDFASERRAARAGRR